MATPLEFAATYCRLHNAAYREYEAAFKRIGARLWRDDKARPLNAANEAYIAKQVARGFTEYNLIRPLTVLDSYPEAKRHRATLNREVNEIYQRYRREWEAWLRENWRA